ncbi:DUF4304 domain-containing protein [Neobacillus sp. LXY-1]|uniref:DUF4304 domain-containing protein n=1 Tax=Neobacillus sp. LXY-1 TaxID=3379133 RepID=UPI003EE1A7D3
MVNLQKELDQIIKDSITPLLKAKGFKKQGRNFFKDLGEIGWCFNIQSSLFNHQENVDFTFNAGIFVPSAYDIYYNEPIPKFPKEYHCIVRKRISELKDVSYEEWYSFNGNVISDKLVKQLKTDVEAYILPFFNIYNTDELITFMMENKSWGPQGKAMLIIVLKQNGYEQKAQKLYDEQYQYPNEQYKEYLKDLANRIGLAY